MFLLVGGHRYLRKDSCLHFQDLRRVRFWRLGQQSPSKHRKISTNKRTIVSQKGWISIQRCKNLLSRIVNTCCANLLTEPTLPQNVDCLAHDSSVKWWTSLAEAICHHVAEHDITICYISVNGNKRGDIRKRNNEVLSCNYCCRRKAVLYILSVYF